MIFIYSSLSLQKFSFLESIVAFLAMIFLVTQTIVFHQNTQVVIYRSSHQRRSMKKDVPRNFAKFTGKHLRQSLSFNKAAHLRPATLLKKRLWLRCFPMNFAKFLRTPFLQNTQATASGKNKRSFTEATLALVVSRKVVYVQCSKKRQSEKQKLDQDTALQPTFKKNNRSTRTI